MMKRIILGTLALTLLTACSKDDGQQALGTLERDRVTFTATSSEIIRALPIKEGSQVTEGEVLVQLDTKNQEAVLAHAVAEQAKADAYLLKLTNGERPEDIAAAQARVARAEAQLVEAQKNYQRKAELVRKKLISQSEKDTALAARDSA
ncbi:lipoprotein, partial [Vibrio parahaemolyticus]